jgi:hypothetical protein
VTREDFRRELGDAVDSISGSPDPALPERVRAALVHAPEQRGPVWIGALAAAVIAVIIVGVLLVGNPLNRGPLLPGGVGHVTPTPCCPSFPTPAPSPSPTPAPSPSPTPTASPLACVSGPTTVTTQTAPPLALIDAVRTGTHTGYDRLTIEFQNGRTGTIEITPQANTKFVRDGIGDTVTLAGKYGLLIKITGADNHTAFSGSTDIKTPSYPGILEVRRVGDFEGTVHWAVGLASNDCYRATILTSPTRLVVDIQTG